MMRGGRRTPPRSPNFWVAAAARRPPATAHRGADAAVLVVLGVSLALRATGAARHHAGLHRRADDADVGRALAGHDSAGRFADVGAVEAEANAADQLRHVALAEVRVGTARARLGAVAARLDTAHEGIEIAAGRLGMRLEHLSNGHLASFSLGPTWRAGCRTRARLGQNRRERRARSAIVPLHVSTRQGGGDQPGGAPGRGSRRAR
jgi:hypothetical protein